MTSPTSAPQARPKPAGRWPLVGAAVAVALLAGALVAWHAWRSPISKDELGSFLNRRVGDKVRFSDVERGVVNVGDGKLRVTFAASGRTTEPLYVKIDAAAYLRDELHLDLPPAQGPESAAGGPASTPPPGLAESGQPPPDPRQATLLKLRTPAGTPVVYRGTLEAVRGRDGWDFTVVEDGFGGNGAPLGEARASFVGPNYDTGAAGDIAALLAVAAERRAYVARQGEAERKGSAVQAEARAGRLGAFLSRLAPGTIYRGAAVERDGRTSPALFLEITSLAAAGNGVTALLRNDGGWHLARLFRGEWHADSEFEAFTVKLVSRPNEAIRDSGPFLEDAQTWTFDFRVEAGGDLSAEDRTYRYHFNPLPQGDAASLRAEFLADFNAAVAATAPGMIYSGVAVSRSTHAPEPLLLRFVQQGEDAASLEARLESPTHKWRRPLSGAILSNTHRSGGSPLRLQTAGTEAVAVAGSASVLGADSDLDLRLRLDGRDLVGEDTLFSYKFSPATAGELQQLDDARRAREQRFSQAFRPGIEYDGTIRDDQGYVVRTRLRIVRMGMNGRQATVSVETRGQAPFLREFAGPCDPADGSLALESTPRARLDESGNVGVPLFSSERRVSLQLALADEAIIGRVDNDERSKLEFPVGAFLAKGPEIPACPSRSGVYVLKDGAWVALPRNGGSAVPYKAPSKANPVVRELGGVVNAAAGELLHTGGELIQTGAGEEAAPVRAGKVADLTFDGKDTVPQVDGARIVILFVGTLRAPPSGSPAAPRDSTDRPAIEIAPTTAGKEGKRSVDLIRLSPGVDSFGNQRAAAYVHDLSPNCVLLITTSALDASTYAVSADEAYELGVR